MLNEFRTLIPHLRRFRRRYALGISFIFIANIGQIAIPQLLRIAVDEVSQREFSSASLVAPLAGLLALALLVAAARVVWRTAIFGASRRIENRIREAIYARLLTLSARYFSDVKTGDLMTRATRDVANVRNATGTAVVGGIDGIFMIAAIGAIMFGQNPRVAALAILPAPMVTLIVLGAGRVLGARFGRVQTALSALTAHVHEALSGIKVLKSFAREGYSEVEFSRRNDEYRTRSIELIRFWGLFFPIISFLAGLATLLLLRIGGASVIDGSMSPGLFVAFLVYLEMLIWPMFGAGYMVNLLQRGSASLGRINAILAQVPDIASPHRGANRIASPVVQMESVEFTYADRDSPAVESVDLHVAPGSTIGIFGRIGSGKSTIARLMPRLTDPTAGVVKLGGRDVREYELGVLRKYVRLVPHNVTLFSDTIRGSIAFGNPSASKGEIQRAAEISTIDRDLIRFPDGFETQIGERGVTLSGGQRQRISISRAILSDPELLILDDALSQLDSESEELILGRFFRLRRGKTNVIVSNRISTIARADVIYVVDEGRVVAVGNHADLIRGGGIYRQMADIQRLERSDMA